MRNLILSLVAVMVVAGLVGPATVAYADEDEDPFTYNPSTHSATVSPGGSTSVTVTMGIDPGGQDLTYPVTSEGWQTENLPSGWTVTFSPSPLYTWSAGNSTVTVTLTVNVPSGATAGTYSFKVKLKPGNDSSTPTKKTVGSGEGVNFSITVMAADTTPPVVRINTPANNARYILGQTVLADWTAYDPESPITSLTFTAASGSPIDTATVGLKTFFVSATSGGGTTTVTHTYYVDYGFLGLLPPYGASGKPFKLGSSIPLKWQYTNYAGSVVDSFSAAPCVEVRFVSSGVEGDPLDVVEDPGKSGLQYDSLTYTWQFNWQTKGLSAGTYAIYIICAQTGQRNGPFSIQLK